MRQRLHLKSCAARKRASVVCSLALLAAFPQPGSGQVPSEAASDERESNEGSTGDSVLRPLPVEERRLSPAEFRAGLEKFGLVAPLAQHVADYPPVGELAQAKMQREIHLAEWRDATRSPEARRSALRAANAILAQMIDEHPDSEDALGWSLSLARSLIYDEAEPFFTEILYTGGTPDDRLRLGERTSEALDILRSLIDQIESEYERVDNFTIPQFERYEASGNLERLDRALPRAEYLLLWVLFYDSLARDEGDAVRAAQLGEILERVQDNTSLLRTPHDTSGVQVQAHLLVGMTARRLGDYGSARELLDRAMLIGDTLLDSAKRESIAWAVVLARIERIRSDRDAGGFAQAKKGLEQLGERIAAQPGDTFALELVAAMLHRSVLRAELARAVQDHSARRIAALSSEAWAPLAELLRLRPDRRAEIYASVYEAMEKPPVIDRLDPVELSALIASLVDRIDLAQSDTDRRDALSRALAVGDAFLERAPRGARGLVPEIVYNLAVAHYLGGDLEEAARRFLQIVEAHPEFSELRSAAVYAVQLSASLYEDLSEGDDAERRQRVQSLYRRALERLLTATAASEDAKYWRFYYAQLLDELGEHERAAGQFARIDPSHENYPESLYLRLRALAARIEKTTAERRRAQATLIQPFDETRHEIAGRLSALAPQSDAPAQRRRIADLRARTVLQAAQVFVLPGVGREAQAIETLRDFAARFPDSGELLGSVWRTRLVAFERLGDLEAVRDSLPAYVAADPRRAGATLQELFVSLRDAADVLRRAGRDEEADRKSEIAVIVAEQTRDWLRQHQPDLTPAERRAMLARLADAYLSVGRAADALEVLDGETLPPSDSLRTADRPALLMMLAKAEALFQLERWEEALPLFNALAVKLSPDDELRWRALLRDLECRAELPGSPAGIIRVIQQQKHLHPEMGGPELAKEFERLLLETQRRTSG